MADNTQDTGQQDQAAYDPEHLAILKKGVEAWNKWRKDNPKVKPNLQGADLCGANLKRADLRGANLKRAGLCGADLEGANLGAVHLETKTFLGNLQGADLSGAYLKDAHLDILDLQGANLRGANLEGAYLGHADLDGVDLRDATLEGADLREVRRMRLDSTVVRRARFSTRATDPWSALRRTYTGSRLLFHVLFLVAFFLPYVAKTAGWVAVSRSEDQAGAVVAGLRQAADELEVEQHPMAKPVKKVVTALSDSMPNEQNGRWQERRVWELVIGVDKGTSYWITAVMLIAYNVFRAVLTWFVSAMREEEERSGHTPQWRLDMWSPNGVGSLRWFKAILGAWSEAYGWLMWLHRPCKVMMWVAVFTFLYHAQAWLGLPVLIPAG